MHQKITPFLWFDGNADSGEAGPGPKGSVMSVTFELDGQEFYALNGGPHFSFTPAVSFFVSCKTQEEVDYFWDKLSEGGQKQPCGWLHDKDAHKSQRVMKAMLQMKKIEIEGLRQAYDGG
jgi:predicted 3-demethylubiquinone-9 3-methyltransferase (glyoxalase superfamily)